MFRAIIAFLKRVVGMKSSPAVSENSENNVDLVEAKSYYGSSVHLLSYEKSSAGSKLSVPALCGYEKWVADNNKGVSEADVLEARRYENESWKYCRECIHQMQGSPDKETA